MGNIKRRFVYEISTGVSLHLAQVRSGGGGEEKQGVVPWFTSVKTHGPESPRDVIIFLPSLSWTTFACALVR